MKASIEEQVAHLVRGSLFEEWARPLDEVVDHVAEEMGVRDPEVLDALSTLIDRAVDDGDGVRRLGEGVVEITRFAEMAAFTHRLGAAEIEADAIDLDVDLCLLRYLAEADGGLHRPEDAAPLNLRTRLEFSADPGSEPRVEHRLIGPDGWLRDHAAGDLVVLHGDDGYVTVEPAPNGSVEPATAVAERLRGPIAEAMDAATEGDGSPIGAEELVLTGLIDGWWPVDEVLPPFGEVVDAIGLEVQGDLVGPPGCWDQFAYLKRAVGVLLRHAEHLDEAAISALAGFTKAFDDFCTDPTKTPDASLAPALHRSRGSGAFCLHEELQRMDPTGDEILAFVTTMPVPRGPAAVVPLMLEQLGRELAGDPVGAEDAAEAAAVADPTWYPALDARLSYLEARGDLRDVVNVMAVLREVDDPELVRLRERLRMLHPDVGRNAPCPCGSGRKFKQCHQGRAELPLPHRVAWLLERAANWTERFAEPDLDVARTSVSQAIPSHPGDPGDVYSAVLADVVLFELGGLERFVAARRHLLPPDDVALIDGWLTGERTSLFRVEGIADDGTLTLVDLAPAGEGEGEGESFEVARSEAFSSVSVHGLVWCRLLPVGDGWVSSGVVMPVRLQQRASVLAALQERAAVPVDGDASVRRTAVAAYLRTLFGAERTGGMLAGDGMPWVLGLSTWHVGDDRDEITGVLDEAFGGEDVAGDAEWTSLDADRTVLATFRLSGCLGANICPGATPSAEEDSGPDEPGVDDELDEDDVLDDDEFDDDEFDYEAYVAYSARIDAGEHGFDVTVSAHSIARLRAAQDQLRALFPDAVHQRTSMTPARRHQAFLRDDQVMESIHGDVVDDDPDGFDDELDEFNDLWPFDEDFVDEGSGGEGSGGETAAIPDDVREQVLDEFSRAYEERWLDMEIPALGGHTPREAVADPKLRPDLLSLLAEFEPMGEGPGQMSTARIRAALGLDPA